MLSELSKSGPGELSTCPGELGLVDQATYVNKQANYAA
nr:hypothetical protein [Tanacetum cinerariifolium]